MNGSDTKKYIDKDKRTIEIIQYNQMREAYILLQKELQDLSEVKEELKNLKEGDEQNEILTMNRILKNEVIEMADQIDNMSETIIK